MQTDKLNPPKKEIDNLINLFHSGHIVRVEKNCKQLLYSYPRSLSVINILGAALQRQEKLDEALQVFDGAVRLSPNNSVAYYNRGFVLHSLGKFEAALVNYNKALKLKRDYVDAYINRGNLLNDIGRFDEAAESYKVAIQLSPNNAAVYSNLGNVQRSRGHFSEAISSYKKAIDIDPKFVDAYINYGLALKDHGEIEEAKACYNKAIMIDPDIAEAHNNLGLAERDLGNYSEALRCYEKAIHHKPGYAEAYINRANVLAAIGRVDGAVVSYDKAIQIDPEISMAYSNYGILLRDIGRPDESLEMMKKSVEKGPVNIRSVDSIIDLMNFYKKIDENPNIFQKIQDKLSDVSIEYDGEAVISDDSVVLLYQQISNVLSSYSADIKISSTQLYRGSIVDLGCQRHKLVFNRFNIIPESCFNCYKVTIYPQNVLDLIKLFMLFDIIKLKNDNMRKCIIEVRKNVSGYYKGFIYCDGLDEAESLKPIVQDKVHSLISCEIPVLIKRGCSEFEDSYPEYGNITSDGLGMMEYREKWKKKELSIDDNLGLKVDHNPNNFSFNHDAITLLDALVMCNWIRYAEEINDLTYLKISGSHRICMPDSLLDMIKSRLKFTHQIR